MTPRRALIAIAVCAALAACAASPERKKEAAARMQMGVTYLDQKNLPAAMRELTKAAELDPENPEIDMVLGLGYQARGELDKAERYLRDAIGKKSDYAEAHNNLGIVLSQQGRGDEAIREYEAAASNVTYSAPEGAYYNMGEDYRRQKNVKKAEEFFRRAIAVNERYPDPYVRLALLQGDQGMWAEAASTLQRCIDVTPSHVPAWLDLGRAYLRLGRRADALEAFRGALANSTDAAQRKLASDLINLAEKDKR